jgi:hypothetical protein
MQMYTSRGKQRDIPKPQLSEEKTRNYFVPQRVSKWGWIALIAGGLLAITGMDLSKLIVFAIGVLVGIVSIVYIVMTFTANPSDRLYEQWVNSQARALYSEGLEALGLDKHSLSAPVIRIASVVLPGSMAAEAYPSDEVRVRRGKDGRLRYSIHVYTYFYPTRDYRAIFKGDVNAWNHSKDDALNETYVYRYHHIMSAATHRFMDTVILEGTSYQYRIDEFCLELSNGRLIPLTAALKAKLLDRRQDAPTSLLPEMVSGQQLRQLRDLLLSQ